MEHAPPVLVLLPGMDGSGALFAGLVAALGAAVSPLVVSYPPNQVLDYAGMTDFARAHLPAGQPFLLLGESFSGPVAIALAAERPAGLRGLILSCSFARNPAPLLRRAGALLPFLPVSSKFTALGAPLLLGAHATPALHKLLRSALEQLEPAVLRARMRAVLGVDYSDLLGEIGVPVLYLQAAQDRVVSGASARHIKALLPAFTVVTVRGPHLLLQGAPAECARHIREFAAQLGR